MQTSRSRAESQGQKAKLANSYNELLEEFGSKDLRSVGNYTLGRLIGKGSFGKVYLASHKLINGSKVVLKSAEKSDSNLAREIHHHRQFLHPHIARLYEVIVTETLVWLVLEYCPGDELYNHLLQHGRLAVDKAQRIFAQLVGAVSYVHNKSCVHRDLKLENILLDKNENVKLCDFGFTREYEGKASYLQTFCGTVCYSAPEMLKGEKYAGEKVDVWSLGVILYALLTGELPFDDDDDNETKKKILTEEPKWPDYLTQDARKLLGQLLSKRSLLRPSLADVLASPFLSEHAPNQQAILRAHQPSPFTTPLEKDVLQRMKSAGVDIDLVIENVLSQRCDALAGWWALLLEKEERKERRREKKRKEREAEVRSLRRLSAASSRLERMAPTLREADESSRSPSTGDPPRSRGRRDRRSFPAPPSDLPRLPEAGKSEPGLSTPPPPPIEKDSVRSVSSSRQRPPLPPKEYRRSRNSALQVISSNPELLSPSAQGKRRTRRKHQYSLLNQILSAGRRLVESAKRAKSPNLKNGNTPSMVNLPSQKSLPSSAHSRNTPQSYHKMRSPGMSPMTPTYPPSNNSSPRGLRPPRISTNTRKRTSLSPSPMTPPTSFRRSSAGLRGRKSTSSSVSSIRSLHHRRTHSKASSTSSNSASTPVSKTIAHRSPRNSVKVLPATPIMGSFPSSITGNRAGLAPTAGHDFTETMAFGRPGQSTIFAKRKKSPFKGPMLNVGSAPFRSTGRRDSSLSRNAAASGGRRSGEIIEEEDEQEVEEVEQFSPTEGTVGELEAGLDRAYEEARKRS